eukprot:COSAG02_NODE_14735_length_1242_cov_1.049869_2_plen_264_part_01
MMTVRLVVTLSSVQSNVYAMAGFIGSPIEFPAAYQVATPFGVDIGGVPPAFFAIANNEALGFSEFDSWLSIGVTDGSAPGAISMSPGFDLSGWTVDSAFSSEDGAIFYMDPASGPVPRSYDEPIVMAQITSAATSGTARAMLQGRSEGGGEDWVETAFWSWPYPTETDVAGGADCYILISDTDVDSNGQVATHDLLLVLGAFGMACTQPKPVPEAAPAPSALEVMCRADVDGSGQVETHDLLLVLGAFGATCTPGPEPDWWRDP